MKDAIEKVIANRKILNVEVLTYEGLTVDVAKEKGAEFLVRGLRNGTDYQYEENIASINAKIAGIETIYFRAGKTSDISSSMVMELKKYNRDISNLVPQEVLDVL
jgi:pantetheine-phosphate adenylyltransferase